MDLSLGDCWGQESQTLILISTGPICITALISESYASTLETLIFTQGLVYGLGFFVLCYPILNIVNEGETI